MARACAATRRRREQPGPDKQPEQHHAAATEIDVASATHFAFTAQRGADLFDDVSRQASFVAIDFRNRAFELDDDFSGVLGATCSRRLTRSVVP